MAAWKAYSLVVLPRSVADNLAFRQEVRLSTQPPTPIMVTVSFTNIAPPYVASDPHGDIIIAPCRLRILLSETRLVLLSVNCPSTPDRLVADSGARHSRRQTYLVSVTPPASSLIASFGYNIAPRLQGQGRSFTTGHGPYGVMEWSIKVGVPRFVG
jgi:hypothetical protein